MPIIRPGGANVCPPPRRFYVPTLASRPDGGIAVEGVGNGDQFEALEIGPDSDVDELYVFTDGTAPPSPDVRAYGPDGQPVRHLFAAAKHIAVGAPYVGPFKGPIVVCPPNAVYTYDSERGGNPSPVSASEAIPGFMVDLKLHSFNPQWFARRRPDKRLDRFLFAHGGTVAETTVMAIPAYGREDFLLAYEAYSIAAGTLTVRVYGAVRSPQNGSGGLTEKLLSTITITAAGADVYEFEGKYDHYRITTQRAGGVTAGTNLSLTVHVRDK